MKQCVGAKNGFFVELEIEIPQIDNPFQLGTGGIGLKKLLPIFESFGANSEGIGIWRSESSSASNGLATRAAHAQSRCYRVADSAVVRKNEPRFFRRNLDDRLH